MTTDFRDVFAEVARAQFGITDASALFPGYPAGDDLIADFTAAVKAASG